LILKYFHHLCNRRRKQLTRLLGPQLYGRVVQLDLGRDLIGRNPLIFWRKVRICTCFSGGRFSQEA